MSAKSIFVNMWYLLFVKLILRRPILVMWQRYTIGAKSRFIPLLLSAHFPDSLAAKLDPHDLF